MKPIVFTKLLKPWNADELIAFAKKMGLAGFDLCVRDGYPITPAAIGRDLAPFVKKVRDAGLDVPMATVGVTALKPSDPATEAAWASCAEAGVGGIKLGYWVWQPGQHYWDQVKAIRNELAGYVKLAARYGVRALFHTHSDPYYGLNASSLMHLLDGTDPAHVGAYLDPAHLALDGEPLEMALDILRGRVAMVAVKNSYYRASQPAGETTWHRGMCKLDEGLVDYRRALRQLKTSGYDGFLSVHGEYDDRHDLAATLEFLEPDLRYIAQVLSEVS